MSLGGGSRASRPWPRRGLLLLGLLLLPVVVSVASDPEAGEGDLHCLCVKTTTRVHPKQVRSLEVIKAGLHCPTPQVIATIRDGSKICVDPQAPLYKKIIKKLLESQPPAA
ncbi:platelet factor 4-like isoform X2 [Equus asinus]|uniref:Multifunctional fusion protein n=2 Tax=Equus TaxID=9789 RepID=A0ABM2FKG6_EQUPR|nr:platelet factor 4 isoform X2 [Equus caballus]XP_008541505.1 PREDICTED: platelet factor 4-like isoform X2 [Equus przewalskii]XP_014694502.1 platelet factor 4-like [Equus asinus]XP_046511706.1 platelet factor 4-like [Equus quagga]